MNGVVDPIIEPGLLHDVDLGAIPPLVTDLPDAVVIEPECRPVTRLLLELDPSDVVAEGVLELAPCADTSVDVPVAFLEGAHHEMSVTVQGYGFSHPPSVTPLPIRGRFPFGLIEGRAVELVMPDELPLFPLGRWGESVFVAWTADQVQLSQEGRAGQRFQESGSYRCLPLLILTSEVPMILLVSIQSRLSNRNSVKRCGWNSDGVGGEGENHLT